MERAQIDNTVRYYTGVAISAGLIKSRRVLMASNLQRHREPRSPRRGPASHGARGAIARGGITKLAQREFIKYRIPSISVTEADIEAAYSNNVVAESPNDAEFAQIGVELTSAKSVLDTLSRSDYKALIRSLDLYADLKRLLRTDYNMQFASNASTKIYEIISQLHLIDGNTGTKSFHNAELPGAFIVAINHYIRTMYPETAFEWMASSLYPAASKDYAAMGDFYGVYAQNRERWLMGPSPNALPEGSEELSGDLTDVNCVIKLANHVHLKTSSGRAASGATLYTSDAGADVSSDFNRQEELTSLLNFGQLLTGVLSLAVGGHLVTKQYTFITPFSRSLIAVMSSFFSEAYITKPLTSRPTNSEVYFVGKGFRGISRAESSALIDCFERHSNLGSPPAWGWPPIVGAEVYTIIDGALLRAAKQIHSRQQISFLNEAVAYCERFKGRHHELGRSFAGDARRSRDAWLESNPVKPISDAYWVLDGRNLPSSDAADETSETNDEVDDAINDADDE
jgi:cap2 methyltransferase